MFFYKWDTDGNWEWDKHINIYQLISLCLSALIFLLSFYRKTREKKIKSGPFNKIYIGPQSQ